MPKNTNNGNSTEKSKGAPKTHKGTPTSDGRKSGNGDSHKQRGGITDTLKPPPRPDR